MISYIRYGLVLFIYKAVGILSLIIKRMLIFYYKLRKYGTENVFLLRNEQHRTSMVPSVCRDISHLKRLQLVVTRRYVRRYGILSKSLILVKRTLIESLQLVRYQSNAYLIFVAMNGKIRIKRIMLASMLSPKNCVQYIVFGLNCEVNVIV